MQSVDIEDIRRIVSSVTGDSAIVAEMVESSPLLGAIPDLDSIAIVNLLLGLERRYGFVVEDDEVEQSIFENLASLKDFAHHKIKQNNDGLE